MSSPVPSSSRRRLLVAATALWALGLAGGLAALGVYSSDAGSQAPAPSVWPADLAAGELVRVEGAATGMIFLHPRCVCSAASLEELRSLVAGAPRGTRWYAVTYRPANEEADWGRELIGALESVPGLRRVDDPEGELARRFGAHTSGHLVLYGGDGRHLYSGGITGARGHVGDNRGRSLAARSLEQDQPCCAESPVFGCPILPPEEL